MEYPHGHYGHHHHHDADEVEEGRYPTTRYPPPDPYVGEESRYPPPQEERYPPPPPHHHRPDPYGREENRYPRPGGGGEEAYYGEGIYGRQSPPLPSYGGGYGSSVQHAVHEVFDQGPYGSSGYQGGGDGGAIHYPGGHVPSFHQGGGAGGVGGSLAGRKTVRVYTKAAEGYSLTIRDGNVVLAPADSSDKYQHWIKDAKYSTRVKDEEGLPSFALVNKVTGQAIKHSIGATHPVQLVPYDPDQLDLSVLWTESKDTGENFRCIRMVNNIRLNFDAFHGDKDHGGVRDGTTVVLWEWLKGENQRWKITSY